MCKGHYYLHLCLDVMTLVVLLDRVKEGSLPLLSFAVLHCILFLIEGSTGRLCICAIEVQLLRFIFMSDLILSEVELSKFSIGVTYWRAWMGDECALSFNPLPASVGIIFLTTLSYSIYCSPHNVNYKFSCNILSMCLCITIESFVLFWSECVSFTIPSLAPWCFPLHLNTFHYFK